MLPESCRAANLGCSLPSGRLFDGPQEPPEKRLQPKLAALQDDAGANYSDCDGCLWLRLIM
jgi:hypothetical protein